MSLSLRLALRMVLAAAVLVAPLATRAGEEVPPSLGSPNMSDNPNIDHNVYGGGDAGSPWPVSIRDARRHGPATQSAAPDPAQTEARLAPLPVFLPGPPPGVIWLSFPAGPVAAPPN